MMKTLIFAFLLFCGAVANAQDYVVTPKNDTLRGPIKILTYDRMDRVEIIVNNKKTHFTCVQLKTVVMNNEIFNPVRTESGYRLMKLSIPGYLSLYLSRRQDGYQYNVETLVMRDGSMMEVPNISFKKILSNYLSSCSDVVEKIKSDTYTRKNIPEIINEYNQCLSTKTKVVSNVPTTNVQNPAITSLNDLKTKIESNSSVNQKDALDILKDISAKVSAGQNIPNYLLEGFKESIKNSPELLADFDKIVTMIKK